jgi:methylmalonyl-CoA epimerase
MISKIEHIGILVDDLDVGIEKYTRLLGLTVSRVEDYEEDGEKARLAFLPIGDSYLELIQHVRTKDGTRPLAGFDHIAVQVGDIEAACAGLKAGGCTLVPDRIMTGSRGSRVAFIKPSDLYNVSLELVEPGKE